MSTNQQDVTSMKTVNLLFTAMRISQNVLLTLPPVCAFLYSCSVNNFCNHMHFMERSFVIV